MRAKRHSPIRVVILSLLILPLAIQCSSPAPEAGERLEGASGFVNAPEMALVGLDGQVTRLSDHRGKVVVLNFWATWCPPCRVELPHFSELYEAYRDRDVVVIGVSFDHAAETRQISNFVQAAGLNYPIAKVRDVDEMQAIERSWSALEGIPTVTGFGDGDPEPANGSVLMVPTTFLIDRAGGIYRKHVGPRERRQLEPEIKHLLGLES